MSEPVTVAKVAAGVVGHARLSPSSAYRWSVCTAAAGAEAGRPDSTNPASRWGTAAHLVSETCFMAGAEPEAYRGRWVHVLPDRAGETIVDRFPAEASVSGSGHYAIPIDDEMIECVATYVSYVRALHEFFGGTLLIEQKVGIEHITGEEGATGTSDAGLYTTDTYWSIDLKGGLGQVDAWEHAGVDLFTGAPTFTPNKQLAMYAHGGLRKIGWLTPEHRDKTVVMVIIQPRLRHISEHRMTVGELDDFVQSVLVPAAREVHEHPTFRPSKDVCHFCKAAGDCRAQQDMVLATATTGFSFDPPPELRPLDSIDLGAAYESVESIEGWCKAVRKRVAEALAAGKPVMGKDGPYKLVQGKPGNRYFTDEGAVADKLAGIVPEPVLWKKKLAGPAPIEKLLKKAHPDVWLGVQQYIDRPKGGLAVAPATDKRPAVSSTEGFTFESEDESDGDF